MDAEEVLHLVDLADATSPAEGKPLDEMRRLMRKVGAVVCSARGHRYFYAHGAVLGWCAYSCIRCGEFDRNPEDLPYRPEDADDLIGYVDEDRVEMEHRLARRWFKKLPIPSWM